MFILNKNTNIIQECSNNDVIKTCKKDPEHFAVAATHEELTGEASAAQEAQDAAKAAEEAKAKELAEAEAKAEEEADNAAKEAEKDTQDAAEATEEATQKTNENAEDQEKDLNAKSVADLRVIAKEKGIQGYGNMNKETLIAVIMAH